MKKYLFGLLILNFPLFSMSAEKIESSANAEQIEREYEINQNYYSLGVSYLDPVALKTSFATTGGYILLGHQFALAWLDNSDISVAAESKLSFGLKGEQHINDYDGGYVVRDGKLTYAASLVIKLNYAINDAFTVFATSGIEYFAWQYQLHDQNSIDDNMEFENGDTAMAWGVGLDYQFTDIAITTEVNSLGFNLGLRKAF
ncbi:MAG: opacity protein-like surface antigen [Moritella dasanensis]